MARGVDSVAEVRVERRGQIRVILKPLNTGNPPLLPPFNRLSWPLARHSPRIDTCYLDCAWKLRFTKFALVGEARTREPQSLDRPARLSGAYCQAPPVLTSASRDRKGDQSGSDGSFYRLIVQRNGHTTTRNINYPWKCPDLLRKPCQIGVRGMLRNMTLQP